MHILVVGGMQFMGREIVQRLLRASHQVAVMHRRDRHDLGPDVENLQADRADLERVAHLLRGRRFDAVVDMVYDFQKGTPAAQVEALAQSCGEGLQRYVFMSSAAVYGAGLDCRENDPLAPDDHPNPYIQHKASSERVLFRMHGEAGFPVTTIRPPFVHGPGQPFYREQFFWDRLLDGRPIILPDEGETLMQWAYVSDVAAACVRAIEVPGAAGEAFNVAHASPVTHRELVETLARVAGVAPRMVTVPRAAIQAAGGVLFMGPLYFGEYLDLPPITLAVDKARDVLAVTPTAFEEALRAGFAWYSAQSRRPVDYAFEDRLLPAV